MYRQLSNVARVVAFAVAKACRGATKTLQAPMTDQPDRYRPYMRAPGPNGVRSMRILLRLHTDSSAEGF